MPLKESKNMNFKMNTVFLLQLNVVKFNVDITGDPEFWQNEEDNNLLLCLTGAAGQGKTSVLAKFVKKALQVYINYYNIINI